MGFIKIHELSQNLGRSEKQLRKLADSGHIPSNRTRGGHRLFELEKVKQALTRADGTLPSAKPAQSALIRTFNQPARDLMQFAFTKMLNNVVDHPGGSFVKISHRANELEWAYTMEFDSAGQSQITTGTRDHDFVITNFNVQLLDHGTEFVSRSEAKRLMSGLEKFEEIVFDFKGVNALGQGFVDEIFRVWISNHPKIKIIGINMNNPITFIAESGMPK